MVRSRFTAATGTPHSRPIAVESLDPGTCPGAVVDPGGLPVRTTLLVLTVLLLVASTLAADPAPRVHAVATSHLDTQWRWTIQTTIDEYLRDTLDDNFALLETYPDYEFNFEGAFRYQLMQEYYPERYERMKRYIAEGRWHVCGSWLDAVDVNMPSPEALFRHTLYGNGFFQREFGRRSVDVFLPDCFGFGYALPSIMAHSGLTGFSTQKLSWGSAYGTPFDIGVWRGVDGSEVLAAVNPGAYVSDLETDLSRDEDVQAAIARTVEAGGPPVAFKYYGTGDTGGAPSEGSVQWLATSVASDGPVQVIPAAADQIFHEITAEQKAGLPVYDGELVMTSHGAGCYTSQAAMKRWNRRCEVLADAAERAAVLAWWLGGADYPHATLERAWTRFLWHGFHDDLTGTSIPEAYTFSWNDMLLSQQEFAQVLETSLEAVTAVMDTDVEHAPLVLFNPLGHQRTEVVVCKIAAVEFFAASPHITVTAPDGTRVPALVWNDALPGEPPLYSWVAFPATVPANGVAVYELFNTLKHRPAPTHGWDADTGVLETARYTLRLDEGGLQSLVDKQTGRELLSAPPRLQLLHNEPANWAAWEVDFDEVMADPYAEVPLGGVPTSVMADEHLARLTFEHEAAGSVFKQTLVVSGDRVDWQLDIDWATKATLLKAAFFSTARDTGVTYDLGLGAIRRGLNRPRLYEVPAQRWADLTDASGQFGLTLMNDGRHGWDHPDEGTLRLTLIHTPAVNSGWSWIDDQKSQDLGRHRLTIGMVGHGARWQAAAHREADALNQPILAFSGASKHEGPWGRTMSLLNLGNDQGPDLPEVAVRAIKKSEQGDWLVVRLQELTGQPVRGAVVAPIAPAREFRELRADEVQIAASDEVDLRGGALVCDLAPYQPRTFALKLAPVHGNRAGRAVSSEPLPLDYDLDGISTREQPTDGDLDGHGLTLPSRLVPAEFTRDGVTYVTGPREPGAANLMRCRGQRLEVPRGATHVRLIMTSVDGAREAYYKGNDRYNMRLEMPDGRRPFGQWEQRVIGDEIVHDRADITPAYTVDADLGWVVTHVHDAQGQVQPYVFNHWYVVETDLEPNPATGRLESLTLPDDPSLVVMAASAMTADEDLTPCSELVDRPAYPSVEIQAQRRAFVDQVEVGLSSPDPGAFIYVARDGGEPTLYDGTPLIIDQTTSLEVTVETGAPERQTRRATFTRLEPWAAAAVAGTTPGLVGEHFEGSWDALPDWDTIEGLRTTIESQVAIPDELPEENVGAVLRGYIEAPARGVYRFWLSSDDGSRLSVGDRVVVDHDGLHGSSAVWGDAPLAAGKHAIEVEFFQKLGGRDLKLEWSGPGFARETVPVGALSHE